MKTFDKRQWYWENSERINQLRRKKYRENIEERKNILKRNMIYQKNHPELYETRKSYYIERYEKTKVRVSTYWKKRNHEERMSIIALLGNKCNKCGFSDWRALQVDHVNGSGRKERSQINNYHRKLKQMIMENPDKYQLLCSNCNWIKKYENREDVHKYE